MKLTHTVSLVELLWTFFTGAGLYYNARIMSRAMGDLQSVRFAGINSLREFTARLSVVMYTSWTIVQFMFFITGVISLTAPIPGGSDRPTTLTYVFSTVFVMVSFILCLTSWYVERGREQLIHMIENKEVPVA